MPKTPSINALLLAADWLDCYDPEPAEKEGMDAVAAFLRQRAHRQEAKQAVAEAGLTGKLATKVVRRLLRKIHE
jgi:hypothetical protein